MSRRLNALSLTRVLFCSSFSLFSSLSRCPDLNGDSPPEPAPPEPAPPDPAPPDAPPRGPSMHRGARTPGGYSQDGEDRSERAANGPTPADRAQTPSQTGSSLYIAQGESPATTPQGTPRPAPWSFLPDRRWARAARVRLASVQETSPALLHGSSAGAAVLAPQAGPLARRGHGTARTADEASDRKIISSE